jgi:hypothetical protein
MDAKYVPLTVQVKSGGCQIQRRDPKLRRLLLFS